MNYSYSIRELDTISIDLTWKRYIYIYMKKKNILFGKSDVNRNTNAPHDPTFPKLFRLFFGSPNLFTSKVKHILDSLTLIGNRFSGVICKHFFLDFTIYIVAKRDQYLHQNDRKKFTTKTKFQWVEKLHSDYPMHTNTQTSNTFIQTH